MSQWVGCEGKGDLQTFITSYNLTYILCDICQILLHEPSFMATQNSG